MSWRRLLSRVLHPGRRGVVYLADRYPQYAIGCGSYGDLTVLEFGEGAKLRMGSYCSVARGAHVFLGGEHRTDWVTTYPFSALDRRFAHIEGHPRSRGDVVIGNDVWLGRDSMVMSGVTIGDGAVVGAGAVVTRDVAPYGIVAGNPAAFVRSRFSPEVVERLLAVAWWNWPRERVDAAMPLLLSPDIEGFLGAVEAGRV
jgi:acetyltransferase-like isoleucine patch superfamily enzyme